MPRVYGCGYNGFHQLDGFLQVGRNNDTGQQSKRDLPQDRQLKHPKLKLLCDLKATTVEDIKITWSRIAICFKTASGSCTTAISGNNLTDEKNEPLLFDNLACQASTDSDILFRKATSHKDLMILEDGSDKCATFNVFSEKTTKADLKCMSGSHNKYHCVYDGVSFGHFSSSRHKEKPKDLSDDATEDQCVLSVLVHHIDCVTPIKEISCGKEHTLLLATSGSVYSFGLSSRGQLGHGDVENEKCPRLIEGLEGLPVKSIAAGGWHSVALSEIGDVYAWGWNESGQLGLSAQSKRKSHSMDEPSSVGIQSEPKCLDVPGESDVKAVACGTRHTVILTEEGCVYSCGWNSYGQLGLGHLDSTDKLASVIGLPGPCCQIFAGHWNSVFVCEEERS